MVEVYAVEVPSSIDKLKLQNILSYLSVEKQDRVQRYLKIEDVYRTVIGELLIRVIICKGLNIRNKDIIFEKNSYGKPYLKNYPDFQYNLSHSGKWVVAAVGEKELGIDIELIKEIDFDIAKRFFSKEEYQNLIRQKKSDKLDYFHRLWSLKESYIKTVGTGLSISLDSFTIKVENENIKFISQRDLKNYYFKEYNIDQQYKMALCSLEDGLANDIIFKKWDQIFDELLVLNE